MNTAANWSQKAISSALWAAYGDALGFITELAENKSGVKFRSGMEKITNTVPWKRKLGGNYGVTVDMAAGTYSDDTQLRLATGRAINSYGHFDVEAFAKIEIPLWNLYALGGGRACKAAAQNLAKKNVAWNRNFYKAPRTGRSYFESGGNGAAMRIQPHIWAMRKNQSIDDVLKDVVRNAITTHGHPHALLGATFHARCLLFCMEHQSPPPPGSWKELLIGAHDDVIGTITNDVEIGEAWINAWAIESSQSWIDSFNVAFNEATDYLNIAITAANEGKDGYEFLIKETDAKNPSVAGMGTLTAIISLAAVFLNPLEPEKGMTQIANTLSTDTDTIATMAGAMWGALNPDSYLRIKELQDFDYIKDEAIRISLLFDGGKIEMHTYPSLLSWVAPAKMVDLISMISAEENETHIKGLGRIIGAKTLTSIDSETRWVKVSLEYGQSIIAKTNLARNSLEEKLQTQTHLSNLVKDNLIAPKDLFATNNATTAEGIDLDANEAFEIARASQFDEKKIGELIGRISKNSSFALEAIGIFSTLVGKALISKRIKR